MNITSQRARRLRTGAVAFIAAVSVVALGGCSTGGGGGSSEGAGEISIMNRWADPVQQETAENLFKAFTEETGIKVKNDVKPASGSTYQPAVRTALTSSTPPSISNTIAGPEVFSLAEAGLIQDITDFYNETIKPRATGGDTAGLVLDDKVYGVSVGGSVGNLIWSNPDYLKKYGVDASQITSFEEWVDAMKKIKDQGGTPIVVGAKDQWPGGHYLNNLVQRAIGSEAATALYNRSVLSGQPDTPKWTDPAVVDSFQKYVDMKPLFQDGFLGEAADTASSLFLSGEVGFYEMGSWLLTNIEATQPPFSPGVMLFPPFENGAGAGSEITLGNGALMISADADREASEKFLEFFTRPDVAAQFGAGLAYIMPYEIDKSKSIVAETTADQWDTINGFVADAGEGGAALFNDQAIDVNIYTQYIWQGSVGLMSGDLTPQQLAQQLEDATVAAQQAKE